MQDCKNDYKGKKLVIRYCEQPQSEMELTQNVGQLQWKPPSFREALAHFPAGKHAGMIAKLARI